MNAIEASENTRLRIENGELLQAVEAWEALYEHEHHCSTWADSDTMDCNECRLLRGYALRRGRVALKMVRGLKQKEQS